MTFNAPANWTRAAADNRGDALVAAMAHNGIDHLFFTSGSELAFYQEAIAKARYHNRPTPRLVPITHEHVSLNAALGFAAVSGKPAATAAHADVGTQHYGCAIHTAWRSGLPVLMTAGAAATALSGSMPGARDEGPQLWAQQVYDQNGIVRQYTKWDHRLQFQDNAGLVISRALQVARSEPCGPVYLSIPREIALLPTDDTCFPTADQLGIATMPGLDQQQSKDIARRLLAARNPFIVVSGAGRNPGFCPALVSLAELLGIPVTEAATRIYQSFPMNHALYQSAASLRNADVILVFESSVPWMPGPDAPGADTFVAVIDTDPIKLRIPTFEFTANLRITADPRRSAESICSAALELLTTNDRTQIKYRTQRWTDASRALRQKYDDDARGRSAKAAIDPLWVSYQLAQALDDNCILIDDSMPANNLFHYVRPEKPGSYFRAPGSSGGWGSGAALGAKLAAPHRDVVMATGDGFYVFGVPSAALWSARHNHAPYLTIIYQNRSYTTGTIAVNRTFPDGYAARSEYHGGYLEPAIDFAKEAEAAGAYGENVRDPAEVGHAIKRGLAQVRRGVPAVISMWLPRLLRDD